MSNGTKDPILPPIVWHLDARSIEDKQNPENDDRLTRIKKAWLEYESSDKPDLQKTLRDIQDICEEGTGSQV